MCVETSWGSVFQWPTMIQKIKPASVSYFSELLTRGESSFSEKIQPPPPQTERSASSATINLVVSADRLAGSKAGEPLKTLGALQR